MNLNPYEAPQDSAPSSATTGSYRGAIFWLFVAQFVLAVIGGFLFMYSLDDKGTSTPAFIRSMQPGIVYVPPLTILFLAFVNITLARVIGSTVVIVWQILLLVVPILLIVIS